MIRFHSFYPWHTGNDYKYFMKDGDEEILKDVHLLNNYDLYSKVDDVNINQSTKEYYSKLLDDFFKGFSLSYAFKRCGGLLSFSFKKTDSFVVVLKSLIGVLYE